MHGLTEHDAHERAGDAEHGDAPKEVRRECGRLNGKARRRDVKKPGHAEGRERRRETGHEAGVVDDADADDLQSEDGGCERCAEKRGENRAHAAERDKTHVFVIEAEEPPHAPAYAAAYLQRRTLAACGAAAQVRQHR